MEATLRIEALTYGTAAIAHAGDGKAVFVEGAAPGDLVRVEIDEDKKRFAHGRSIEVLEAGEARVAPACPAAGTCGGCPWAHVSYEAQLEAKRANTVAQLVRVARFDRAAAEAVVAPCVPCKKPWGYRNKLEMGVGADAAGHLVLGMHADRSHELANVANCPLAHKPIQKAPKALQGALRFLQGSNDLGLFRVGVRHSDRTKSTEIALWTAPGPFPRAAAAKMLKSALHATSIVRVIAEPGKARKIKSVEVLAGAGYWTERLGDFTYKVSAPSFFQVNTAQAQTLIDLVRDGLHVPSHGRVADLYCGVGTFTLPLADICDDVVGVESASSSVRDLRRNADENGVWIEVTGGDSARELPLLGTLDALVVDPPRAGLADGVPESIAAAKPGRVAYVSCDPATWARDVACMETVGYALERATPVDLFPQTYHNEVVSIFARL